jgi:hypothetical protein
VLNKHDPLKRVLLVSEDFLGVYEYDAKDLFEDQRAVNRATIRLYWGVIGLVSQWLGCAVEDLAVVVLTHELAHAYTQLGADIEGRRWAAPAFARSETALKEGLAQYYTGPGAEPPGTPLPRCAQGFPPHAAQPARRLPGARALDRQVVAGSGPPGHAGSPAAGRAAAGRFQSATGRRA